MESYRQNLLNAPQVAETIFCHDRQKTAGVCEKVGLNPRALKLYSDSGDIKRVLGNTAGNLNAEWMSGFLSKMGSEVSLDILAEILTQ